MYSEMTTEKPLERKIQRRFLPFALVGLLAPLTALIPPQPEEWTLVWLATGLTLVIALVGTPDPRPTTVRYPDTPRSRSSP